MTSKRSLAGVTPRPGRGIAKGATPASPPAAQPVPNFPRPGGPSGSPPMSHCAAPILTWIPAIWTNDVGALRESSGHVGGIGARPFGFERTISSGQSFADPLQLGPVEWRARVCGIYGGIQHHELVVSPSDPLIQHG